MGVLHLKIFLITKSKHDKCVYSENQNQKNNSLCGSYCLYTLYCMLLFSLDFRTAVLNLFFNKQQKEELKPIK